MDKRWRHILMEKKIKIEDFIKDYIELFLNDYRLDFYRKYANNYKNLPDYNEVKKILSSDEYKNLLIDNENSIKQNLLIKKDNSYIVYSMIPDDRRIITSEKFFDNLKYAIFEKIYREIYNLYQGPRY